MCWRSPLERKTISSINELNINQQENVVENSSKNSLTNSTYDVPVSLAINDNNKPSSSSSLSLSSSSLLMKKRKLSNDFDNDNTNKKQCTEFDNKLTKVIDKNAYYCINNICIFPGAEIDIINKLYQNDNYDDEDDDDDGADDDDNKTDLNNFNKCTTAKDIN